MKKIRYVSSIILVVWLLSACTADTAENRTDDQTHRDFIQAVQDNNRESIMELMSPDIRDQVALRYDDLRNLALSDSFGELQNVNVEVPIADGMGRTALSTWTYADQTHCIVADLAEIDDVWYITDWNTTTCE